MQTVAYLHKELQAAGFKADALHGQRSQEEREASLRGFRAGKVQVLVATDVAARGLHVRHLPYIVNYDFPSNLEAYVHRVGRTGTPPPADLPPPHSGPRSALCACRSPWPEHSLRHGPAAVSRDDRVGGV